MPPVDEIHIAPQLAEELRRRSDRAAPREFCALLSGSRDDEKGVLFLNSVRPVVNFARDRGFFVVRTADVAPLGPNDAFFHSHVDRGAKLSMHDRRCSVTFGGYVVVGAWHRSIPALSAFHHDHGPVPVTV